MVARSLIAVLLMAGSTAAAAQAQTPVADPATAQTAAAAPASDTAPAAAAATPAAAPVAAIAPATKCELHVWPAERFMARTMGWLGGMGIVGALADGAMNANRDKNNRTQIASALSSEGQVEALSSLDLVSLLKAESATVVRHDAPLERATMNKVKTRRADSKSPCYSELIVGDVLYMKSPIYGRSLRTLFMYRNFGSGDTIVREYKNWGGNGLKLFPPAEGDDIQASNDELTSVFKANFTEFASNAAKSSKPR